MRTRVFLIAMLLSPIIVARAAGPAATTRPTTRPAPATAPVDPAVEAVLDRMEAAGAKFRTLTADIQYEELDVAFEDLTVHTGQVYYSKDPAGKRPANFRIHFDRIKQGRVRRRADRDYVFTTDEKGQWFIYRDGKTKQWRKHQVAPPGKPQDALKLGKGPFPVPFGQKKADVLRLFTVTIRKPTGKDPKGTTCLLLVPRKKAAEDLTVLKIEMWVNKDGLPEKIRTEEGSDDVVETEKTAIFDKINTKARLKAGVFDLRAPSVGSGWEVEIKPLPKTAPPIR